MEQTQNDEKANETIINNLKQQQKNKVIIIQMNKNIRTNQRASNKVMELKEEK